MEMRVTGVCELKARLLEVRQQMTGPAMRKAVRAGGQVIAVAMEMAAPMLPEKTPGSDSLEPGELKADIKVRMRTEEGEPVAYIGPGKKTARVARWVEYGHRLVRGGQLKVLANGRTKGRGSLVGEVPPHPFLRPAYEATVNEAQSVIAETLRGELAKGGR